MENIDFNEIEEVFDIDLGDFDLDDDSVRIDTRIHKPKFHKPLNSNQIKYTNAKKLALDINLSDDYPRHDCLVNGQFVFGDFIESFFTEKNIKAKRMVISTLSLSQENVDSLRTLLEKGYCDDLTIIVSDYFFSHERNGLIKYMYEELDLDNKFQLVVCRTHTKICFFETMGGKKIVVHGSANLRTSDNIEQFTIEINESLFNFYDEFHKSIIERFQTINKSVRNKDIKDKLWLSKKRLVK